MRGRGSNGQGEVRPASLARSRECVIHPTRCIKVLSYIGVIFDSINSENPKDPVV